MPSVGHPVLSLATTEIAVTSAVFIGRTVVGWDRWIIETLLWTAYVCAVANWTMRVLSLPAVIFSSWNVSLSVWIDGCRWAAFIIGVARAVDIFNGMV